MSIARSSNIAGPKRRWPWRLLRVAAVLSLALVFAAIGLALTLLFVDESTLVKVKGWTRHSWIGARVAPDQQAETIATSLLKVTAATFNLPALAGDFRNGGGAIMPLDGRLLVAERTGRFFAVDLRVDPAAVQPLPLRLELNEDALMAYAEANGFSMGVGRNVGMAGLGTRVHDLTILDGRRLAASYTYWDPQQNCAAFRVASVALPQDWAQAREEDWQVDFETRPCLQFRADKNKPFSGHQAGGRLLPLAVGKLLVTVGDYKFDGLHAQDYPQDPAIDYGKLFEIDLASGARRMISMGHRNPQGLMRDRAGRIWATEHGPQGGDELNLIEEGRNYGWPLVTLGTGCGGCGWQLEGRHDGFTPPVYSWIPSIGVSNLIELQGFAPEWDGDVLVGSLVGQSLRRLRLENGRVLYDEVIAMGDRIRDLVQDADGSVLLWTDSGKLIRLTANRTMSASAQLLRQLPAAVKQVVADCGECHGLENAREAADRISLWGVVGRRFAAGDSGLYSPALKQAAGTWDEATLDRFLANPQSAMPGTSMPYAGVPDADTRRQVIEFLKTLR